MIVPGAPDKCELYQRLTSNDDEQRMPPFDSDKTLSGEEIELVRRWIEQGANLTAQIYKQDSGDKLYRKSMYTFWKRTAPPPAMLLFDAPDRERCVVRREQTNTPLRALVLMNDPTYIEAARQLAARVMTTTSANPAERVTLAFRLATARQPDSREVSPLVDLYERQRERFAADPKAAEELLAVGESSVAGSFDKAELAAYAVVMSVILNLDETISKR